jgi:hypothetical protein
MKLEEIYEEWEKDSFIDEIILDDESLKIPKLHFKYLKFYNNENLLYLKMLSELKKLKQEKRDFYLYGQTKETLEKKWELPPQGKILKSEIPDYIEGDQDIIDSTLKVSFQLEKVNTLKAIMDMIKNRGFQIKECISFKKWESGG